MGRTILKRTYTNNQAHDTYYVYDAYGLLRFVIPPEAIQQLGSSLTQINESSSVVIVQSNLTLNTPNNSNKYYYLPNVTITLGPNFTSANGFEILPYPLDLSIVDGLVYMYRYDERKRMIVKKVPGADSVLMVYDNRDRLVLTQDGEMRSLNKNDWHFVKYDVLNRPVLTGIQNIPGTRNEVASLVTAFYNNSANKYFVERTGNSSGTHHGYTNDAYPKNVTTHNYLTAAYYDDYSFVSSSTNYGYPGSVPTPYNANVRLLHPRGQLTGGKVKVLNTTTWLENAVYYNRKQQPIYTVSANYMSGFEKYFFQYDFIGNLKSQRHEHTASGQMAVIEEKQFEYDHAGRLTFLRHKLGSALNYSTLARYQYNELGQLTTKRLHSTNELTYAQVINYEYNIRGWLTAINNPNSVSVLGSYFGMYLRYHDPLNKTALNSLEQYNGNISEIHWNSASSASSNRKSYGYKYDKLNRLTHSTYAEGSSYNTRKNYFNENIGQYDFNGNIKALTRTGTGTNTNNIDVLNYEYLGNKLLKVTDTAPIASRDLGFKDGNTVGDDYQYDVNGNMVQDLNKGIQSITYNHLNLPRLITFAANKSIEYAYDANGTKLRKTVIDGGVTKITNYVGSLVYEGASDIFLNTEEGRVVLKEGGFLNEEYQYHLKDHLGNVRVTFTTGERLGGFYSSSMEQEDSDIETLAFKNVDETRHTDMVFNHTEGGKSSARLNAAEGRVVGPSLNLHLQAGDTVKMEVYARYIEKARKKQSLAGIGALIAASLGTTPAGEIPEVIDAVKGALGMGHLSAFSQDQSIPKAYLQYLFFDKSFNFVNAGFRQVSKEAENDFELLSLDYTADQEGYLMMFVANETADDLNVFFPKNRDRLTILVYYTALGQSSGQMIIILSG
ncbi:MAG: hypothetical protein JJU28_21590 [Cyclobacteriaceae bacterium]|nr:hypothetical protein [Cyclobacteriaceae bacterium]